MTEIRRGDIYYIKSFPRTGSEQSTGRPAVIVSNNKNNKYSPTVEIVFLTTRCKAFLPTHTVIRSSAKESLVLCEQVTTVDKSKLEKYLGHVSESEMKRIDQTIMISLGIAADEHGTVEGVSDNSDALKQMIVLLAEELRATREQYDALKQSCGLYRPAV